MLSFARFSNASVKPSLVYIMTLPVRRIFTPSQSAFLYLSKCFLYPDPLTSTFSPLTYFQHCATRLMFDPD